MAMRRASMNFLRALEVQGAGIARPAAVSSQQLHSMNQSKNDDHATFEYEAAKMTAEGGSAEEKSFQEKSSEVLQAKAEKLTGSADVKDKAEEVKDKAEDTAGEVKDKAEDTAGEVKDKAEDTAGEVKEKAEGVTDSVKDQASKEADTAKDMFKDFPQKVSETATGLKEVGVEAGKAVKRDAGKVAEKVGLKSES